MANVYYVNDTSAWHRGSAATNQSLKRRIIDAGHKIIGTCYRPDGPIAGISRMATMMIVNGEGTFRSQPQNPDDGRIYRLQYGITEAMDMGLRVYLTNAVWYDMMIGWTTFLTRLRGTSVREIKSKKYIELMGARRVEVHPDECYFNSDGDRTITEYKYPGRIVMGDFYDWNTKEHVKVTDDPFRDMPRLSMFNTDWGDLVANLRGASCYVTGLHHGVYAACKAKVPFACCHVNTWKVSGMFEWAGVRIPIATTRQEIMDGIEFARNNPDEFRRLFEFLDKQTPWKIPK